MKNEYTANYDDIVNLPHHTSSKHPRMSLQNRAAQFSPFAALTGHEAAIKETRRLTDRQVELDENAIEFIDRKLKWIRENISSEPEITVTYFIRDIKKSGGKYVTTTVCVGKVDSYENCLVTTSGEKIFIKDIIDIRTESETYY